MTINERMDYAAQRKKEMNCWQLTRKLSVRQQIISVPFCQMNVCV